MIWLGGFQYRLAPLPEPYDCSPPWRPGSQVMAQCKLGRPAMGSDSTIPRSGRQGPPLPDTDLAQAAGPDPKIGNLSWARGSGPGPGAVIGPGQEPYELPGLGEGDGEAERLDLRMWLRSLRSVSVRAW
jgi:hypothetical protein